MHFGNQAIPNNHFHKKWQKHVKTWFDQPAKKHRRVTHRLKKAREVAPRPLGLLRPVVRCPTIRYNKKVRAGRGFTIQELKQAGINKKVARSIGISVDHRRRNKSQESLQLNGQRLKEYRANLILFPRRKGGKVHAGEASEEERSKAVQQKSGSYQLIKQDFPRAVVKSRAITASQKDFQAYNHLRRARGAAKSVGRKEKKAKERDQELVPGASKKADAKAGKEPKEAKVKEPKEPKEAKPKKEKPAKPAKDE